MYVPKKFKAPSDQDVREIITQNSFGILITTDLQATHIPMELVTAPDGSYWLEGHLSRINPHANALPDQQVMAIFQGPHAYVSSSWYGHINVPTWNYVAVHVYGKAELLSEADSFDLIRRQLSKYESKSENPVTIEKMPDEFLSANLKGITCFRIAISRMEASFKLSQNRNENDYTSIIRHLEKQQEDQPSGVAELMRKYRKQQNTN